MNWLDPPVGNFCSTTLIAAWAVSSSIGVGGIN